MKTKKRLILIVLGLLNACLAAAVLWLLWLRREESLVLDADGLPRVLATVNGRPILDEDWRSAARLPGQEPSPERDREILQRLIQAEVVMQQSGALRADEDLRILQRQFATDADYREALAGTGLGESRLRERLARMRGAGQWLKRAVELPEPTAEQLQAYWADHRSAFILPGAVEARHFVAIFPPDGNPQGSLATVDRIQDAQQRLRDGLPLDSLISALSDDPAKAVTGGSLSWLDRERMEPALAEAAFSLPIGQISAPVQTRFGFHLLEVTGRREEHPMTFAEGRPEIEARWRDEQRVRRTKALVAELVSRANVVIYAKNLR